MNQDLFFNYQIGNINLTEQDMRAIHDAYEVAHIAELLYENYDMSSHDAMLWAEDVREYMRDESCSEEDAIANIVFGVKKRLDFEF